MFLNKKFKENILSNMKPNKVTFLVYFLNLTLKHKKIFFLIKQKDQSNLDLKNFVFYINIDLKTDQKAL